VFTFGSFHRRTKINAPTVAAWSRLLCSVPESQLLVAGVFFASQQQSLIEQFGAHGVGPERLRFHPRSSLTEYLGLHAQVDLCLDTQPYAGATTTMHSLWMGVPTLTIAGATAPARAGAGIMGGLGLSEFVARDGGDFVARGVHWSTHREELAEIRAGLRARLQAAPVGQPGLIVAHLERAFRHMWRRWCADLPPESFRTEG
jgi:predicted O-linked N-acetylglucosamine transferase (SPINDLY family)